jgi:hypothetical protein
MVVVESCGVEGWIVSERHAAGQRELEEALVLGRAQQLRLIQLRARALHIQLKSCRIKKVLKGLSQFLSTSSCAHAPSTSSSNPAGVNRY